jgi:hypothetical protein
MFIFLIPAGKLRDIIWYFILIKYTNIRKFLWVDFIIQTCLTTTNQSKMLQLLLNIEFI